MPCIERSKGVLAYEIQGDSLYLALIGLEDGEASALAEIRVEEP